MRGFIGRLGWRSGFVIAAALAITGGIAYATIPSSAGVYTACKLNSTGTIRLIDPSLPATNALGHCTSLETQISWNQQGQPGAQGPVGPAGPKGDSGPAGAQGPAGANGAPGNDGADGKDGVSVTSAVEAAGGNCATGGSKFTSVSGDTYACNGAAGAKGADGADGKDGKDGLNGTSITTAALASGDTNCSNGGASFTDGTTITYACNGKDGQDGAPGPTGPPGPAGSGSGSSVDGTSASVVFLTTCAVTTVLSKPITLSAASKILAIASGVYTRNDTTSGSGGVAQLDLLNSSNTVVGSTRSAGIQLGASDLNMTFVNQGVLLATGTGNEVFQPGTYTLRLSFNSNGICGTNAEHPFVNSPELSYITGA